MSNHLLTHLNGKTPQECIDNLYSAIYVCTRRFVLDGFPLTQACTVIGNKNDVVIKQLMDELRNYVYIDEE